MLLAVLLVVACAASGYASHQASKQDEDAIVVNALLTAAVSGVHLFRSKWNEI